MEDVYDFIRKSSDSIEYGMVQFTVKKHDGLISSVDANKNTQYRVKDNVEAVAMTATLIKAVQQKILEDTKNPTQRYTPPTLTFTILFHKDGQAERIHVNDFNRKAFQKS